MPWRKQRTATFYDKEIFKVLPMDGVPTKPVVIDSTSLTPDPTSGRYVLEAGQILCKAKTGNVSQVSTITNTATGGTGTVSINGTPTAALAWNVSADDMEGAIIALPGVNDGDVEVTKVGQVYTLKFGGALANQAVAVVLGVGSLTGGTWTLGTPTPGAAGTAGSLVRPAAASGEAAADIVGVLTHGLEFFYPVEAGITDEPASVYYAWAHLDVTKLVGYSGNAANVQTALPHLIFS